MPLTQNIPNQRLTGVQTFTFLNSTQEWATAQITIDRTVSQGLNTLTSADTLTLAFDQSPDGGTTWFNIGGSHIQGGTIVTKA
jgi:hypothetical protein